MDKTEMNFCRRCGMVLTNERDHLYKCANGHTIYLNASPAVGVVLYNDQHEVLVMERGTEPGKGKLSGPGGFCDKNENAETALIREVQEEIGLTAQDYESLEYVLTGIDPYAFAGETSEVFTIMFRAKLKPGVQPQITTEASVVKLLPPAAVDLGQMYFPTVREAFRRVMQELDKF